MWLNRNLQGIVSSQEAGAGSVSCCSEVVSYQIQRENGNQEAGGRWQAQAVR